MEEELLMKTFRLEPSVWKRLEEIRKAFNASNRTDALRMLINQAEVEPAKARIKPILTSKVDASV